MDGDRDGYLVKSSGVVEWRKLQVNIHWNNVEFWLVQLDLATLKFNVIA
jgi:hypothetical protein